MFFTMTLAGGNEP